jgi:deoxyribonuclease IV
MLPGMDTARRDIGAAGPAGGARRKGDVDADAALPLIGAQLSTAGGFLPVPQRALDIGAEVVQIFNTNPRMWKPRLPAPGELEGLVAGLREADLRLVFHSTYLINLASPDEGLRLRSSEALALALETGALTGAEAVVVHVGSHRGEADEAERRVISSIWRAVELAEDRGGAVLPALLLETGAGGGNTLGGRLEELQTLLYLEEAAGLASELPLGICIDTAHLFASGYPLHEEEGLERTMSRLGELGLLDRVGLVHLNDSKTSLGVKRDVHENPGDGLLGYEGLARVVRHPALRDVPFVLETPGYDGHGPDAANMAVVRAMRTGAPRPRVARAGPPPQGRLASS